MNLHVDIAIIGSGFGGSLLAMIAKRSGHSVALLEKHHHPRFAIGESSTPLANLLLEQLATRYDLPNVMSLAKFGSWQKTHPNIACGLKRGFSFFHHNLDQPWTDSAQHEHQLLVAASPHDRIADTHWYRPDFDHYLVSEAQALGVNYLDGLQLKTLDRNSSHSILRGEQAGQPIEIHAQWVIDASGPRGFLFQALDLPESRFPHLPDTTAVYAHFHGARPFQDLISLDQAPPYPIDDAALHHVFEGGWIWALRFQNGVTSAGAALQRSFANSLTATEAESMWHHGLERLPTVRAQFADATLAHPFQTIPRLSFRCDLLTGPGWTLLPSAAGFVDPLLSTGFTLNLLGLQRLARMLEEDWASPGWAAAMQDYERQTHQELDTSAQLIAALYAHLNNFPLFTALTRLYFAAVSFSETALRLQKPDLAGPGFLLSSRPEFHEHFMQCCREAIALGKESTPSASDQETLVNRIDEAIAPFDIAGLRQPPHPNWHPVRAQDLFANAQKLNSNHGEIEQMLQRAGFLATATSASHEG